MDGRRFNSFASTVRHHPDGLADAEMNGMDAIVAIRKESPEAKIIILTTYESDVPGAMKAGRSGLTY